MVAAAMLMGASSFAQIQDEKNVTITMELVPILQLNMNTPDQVNFVFDEIGEYIGGITKYGATILTASATVSFDLYASGTSGDHAGTPANRFWDVQVAYGIGATGAIDALPLTALELHQFPADVNAGTGGLPDYGTAFAPVAAPVLGQNNVWVSPASAYDLPLATERYIAGHLGNGEFVEGGSYLTAQGGVGVDANGNAYYFVIDYRIVPGLPAIFPIAATQLGVSEALDPLTGEYAQPGVYTMNVKYLMIENQ